MTCMKQEFCIHEKYCQRHIGQNFDSCILFSRNSKPMTNEEWLRQATTEQLAEQLLNVWMDGAFNVNAEFGLNEAQIEKHKGYIVEWLKQPHREESKK